MATFSLRLDGTTSEALDRLVIINGLSKNAQIQALIAQAYAEIDKEAQIIMGDLQSMTNSGSALFGFLAAEAKEAEKAGNHKLAVTRAKQAYRFYTFFCEQIERRSDAYTDDEIHVNAARIDAMEDELEANILALLKDEA